MSDPRLVQYAGLLVERCIDVQPGQQVLIRSTPVAEPLIAEVVRGIARRGAFPFVRLTMASISEAYLEEAAEEMLAKVAPFDRMLYEQCDAQIVIGAPENLRDNVAPERKMIARKAAQPLSKRMMNDEIPWVYCEYPTNALAQEAGMSLRAFTEFVYGACLIDWDEEGRKMARIKERFDRTDQVRIEGAGTNLTFSIKGRPGIIDAGHKNMPGGEVFYAPLDGTAEGVIEYGEFPLVWSGQEVQGARLIFQEGRVVESSARSGGAFLESVLDTDFGARAIGEFGIGCNPGIQRYMKSILYDEKIAGTIHLALGDAYPVCKGTNQSAIHWDMVKDLRSIGRISCDGEVVQENGVWLI